MIFEDMLHYTTVKTNMFNGITHPSIALAHDDGTLEMLKVYAYEDYKIVWIERFFIKNEKNIAKVLQV